MAGELNLKTTANVTVYALVWGPDRAYRWNGTAMVNVAASTGITDAAWLTGAVTMTEVLTKTNGTHTGTYWGNFPAAITTPGEYVIEYYASTAATPGSAAIGVQDVWWDGVRSGSPATVDQKGDVISGAPVAQ